MPELSSKTKINVLIAADHAAYNGNVAGVGRYLANVLPKIDSARFNLRLLILREAGSMQQELEGSGVQLIAARRGKFDPMTLRSFLSAMSEQQTDLLHLHQYASSNFGRLAGQVRGVPNIIHLHGPDLPYPPYQWLADRLLAPFNDRCVAVSESVGKEVSARRAINPGRITTLHNGIPLQDFQPASNRQRTEMRRLWEIPDSSPIVGTVTRLHAVKGNRYLLKAASLVLKEIPDVYFVFVGDGPLLGQLEELAAELRISRNVVFTGYREDSADLLSIFDIKVIASIAEGHPQALLEAMAMGKAIVATEVGGIPEVIRDGSNGLLVPPANPERLAQKIIHLLRHPQERDRLGLEASKQSLNYSLDAHVNKLEDLYEGVVLKREALARTR